MDRGQSLLRNVDEAPTQAVSGFQADRRLNGSFETVQNTRPPTPPSSVMEAPETATPACSTTSSR